MDKDDLRVFLYVPNIIDYVRISLLIVAYFTFTWPSVFLFFYTISCVLDFFDGYAARKLNQISAFGTWLDVAVDILGRSMVWCQTYQWGWLIVSVEWLAFVCFHTQGMGWKNVPEAPAIVKAVMRNGFKTIWGLFAIGSLDCLPVCMYIFSNGWLTAHGVPYFLQYFCIGVLSAGRALCMVCEVWVIWSHVLLLVRQTSKSPIE
ncbi:uncharacterized protein LOC141900181 [Tubulanus polymorphus]|uniref:uncharacterized protein LOC141900181 n=1 Tax=Tubulanus polymorphus TaxID=672921 RepID=UPI003DA6118E